MGQKPTGGKRGRKSDLTGEQIELLESYGERFQSGAGTSKLYSEVTNKWIDTFGYAGVDGSTKNGVSSSDLHLDKDLDTLSPEERKPILEARETARQMIRGVCVFWYKKTCPC